MKFTYDEMQMLGEIGNISVGNSASSLSDFINRLITITCPDPQELMFQEIKEKLSPSLVVTKIDFKEGLEGSNLMIMEKEEAIGFVKFILKEKLNQDFGQWDDENKEVLAEVFNIMIGNMSSALSEQFEKNVRINTPEIYELDKEEMDFFGNDEKLISIWFEMNIENIYHVKIVQIITKNQAKNLIDLAKEAYEIE